MQGVTEKDADPVLIHAWVRLPQGLADELDHGLAVGNVQEGNVDEVWGRLNFSFSDLPTMTLHTSRPWLSLEQSVLTQRNPSLRSLLIWSITSVKQAGTYLTLNVVS